MPATNYTPIQLYRSTTSGNIPNAANLSAGEIALNIADNDMTMYFENASGTVKSFFNNPAALKYPTADGTSGQFVTTNGAGVLSFGSVAAGSLTNNTRQAVTSSATTTLNLNSGNVIDLTMAANITTLSFTNVPASGTPILVQIIVKNAADGTSYTITWPNSVYWSSPYTPTTFATVQTAPTLAAGPNGITVLALLTTDGGTNWRGWVEGIYPLVASNQLFMWGNNAVGNLGQNNTISRSSPVQVGALNIWVKISASTGNASVLAIANTGALFAWGYNVQGKLGLNSTPLVSSPTQVGSLLNWSSASCGSAFSLAIKTDGTLWAWGNNINGQLGQNDRVSRSSPVQIGGASNWAQCSAAGSTSSAAITTTGELYTWGYNISGQLGLNDKVNRSSPTQVGLLTTWAKVQIAGGFQMVALTTGNALFAWGDPSFGVLGNSNNIYRSSPVQIGSDLNWADVSMNGTTVIALKTTGTMWGWGYNVSGNAGINAVGNRSSPVQIGSDSNWAKISGAYQSFAIKTTGTLWGWGNNDYGGVGDGTAIGRSSPVQIGAATNWTAISSGNQNSAGLRSA